MIDSWATDEDDATEQPRWGRVGKLNTVTTHVVIKSGNEENRFRPEGPLYEAGTFVSLEGKFTIALPIAYSWVQRTSRQHGYRTRHRRCL